jgi:hypothetical protein
MGGSKQTTTQNTTREPWAPASGNLQQALSGQSAIASDVNNFTPQYSQTYNNALGMAENLATGQSNANQYLQPVVAQSGQNFAGGNDYLSNVMTGDPTNNPYLEDIIRRQQESTNNAVNGQFSAAGRYGSGAHTGSLTKELGNQELNLRYQDYGKQQGRMDNAASTLFNQGYQGSRLAPQLDQSNYQQAQILQDVGVQRNAQLDAPNQAKIAANQFLTNGAMGIGNMGGTSESVGVTKTPSNPFGMVMGGLQMGAGLLGGPIGGMVGGALGSSLGGLVQPTNRSGQPLYGPGYGPF